MKAGFTTLAKLLAVCFSLTLFGGYVWWRLDQQRVREKERLAIQQAIELKAAEDGVVAEVLLKELDEAVMSSSKNPSRVIMPSSKQSTAAFRSGDFAIVGNSIDDILAEPGLNQEIEDKERVLLPGSKYGGVAADEVPKLEDIPVLGPLFKGKEEKPEPEASKE